MRTIYWAFSEEYGECEAMFDQEGTMIGMWACNDASWRNEYFSPFLAALGIEINDAPPSMVKKLEAESLRMWGPN